MITCRGDVIIYACRFWTPVERGCNTGPFFPVTLYMRCDGNLRGLYKKKLKRLIWNETASKRLNLL